MVLFVFFEMQVRSAEQIYMITLVGIGSGGKQFCESPCRAAWQAVHGRSNAFDVFGLLSRNLVIDCRLQSNSVAVRIPKTLLE